MDRRHETGEQVDPDDYVDEGSSPAGWRPPSEMVDPLTENPHGVEEMERVMSEQATAQVDRKPTRVIDLLDMHVECSEEDGPELQTFREDVAMLIRTCRMKMVTNTMSNGYKKILSETTKRIQAQMERTEKE